MWKMVPYFMENVILGHCSVCEHTSYIMLDLRKIYMRHNMNIDELFPKTE